MKTHRHVHASIRRMRAAGIKAYILEESSDLLVLMLDTDSVLRRMARRVKEMLTYKPNYVVLDLEKHALLAVFYKESARDRVNEIIEKAKASGGEVL